jgi:hypothetical protein
MRELVHDIEHAELAPIMRPILDEVVGPDVVRPLRSEPDAGAVCQPQSPFLGLLGWHLEPFPAPDPLDALDVHRPARGAQESRDLAVAVAAILPRQGDDVGGQRLLVVSAPRYLALCRAMLAERLAGAAFGDVQLELQMLNTGASACGA